MFLGREVRPRAVRFHGTLRLRVHILDTGAELLALRVELDAVALKTRLLRLFGILAHANPMQLGAKIGVMAVAPATRRARAPLDFRGLHLMPDAKMLEQRLLTPLLHLGLAAHALVARHERIGTKALSRGCDGLRLPLLALQIARVTILALARVRDVRQTGRVACAAVRGADGPALRAATPTQVRQRRLLKCAVLRTHDGHRRTHRLVLNLAVVIRIPMDLARALDKRLRRELAGTAGTHRTTLTLPMVRRQLPEAPVLGAHDFDLGALVDVDHLAIVVPITMDGARTLDELLGREPPATAARLRAPWAPAATQVVDGLLRKGAMVGTHDGHRDIHAIIGDLTVVVPVAMHLTSALDELIGGQLLVCSTLCHRISHPIVPDRATCLHPLINVAQVIAPEHRISQMTVTRTLTLSHVVVAPYV